MCVPVTSPAISTESACPDMMDSSVSLTAGAGGSDAFGSYLERMQRRSSEGKRNPQERHSSIAWKVLPARLAISIRLERLEAVRSPRALRASPMGIFDYVCRLRLSIIGMTVLASHPALGLNRRLMEMVSVGVRWDRNDGETMEETVTGPCYVTPSRTNGSGWEQGDILLSVPVSRKDLVLAISVQSRAGSSIYDENLDGDLGKAGSMIGEARIDWSGLACLPTRRTNYFVDTPDTDSPLRGKPDNIPPPVLLTLELLSPLSRPPSTSASYTHVSTTSFHDDVLERNTSQSQKLQTAGLHISLKLSLEESPAFMPHVLEFSPIAARARDKVPFRKRNVTVGDFRNPSRFERFPYLCLVWPPEWNKPDLERNSRKGLVPHHPWKATGRHREATWPQETACTRTGIVSVRLPVVLPGVNGGECTTLGIEREDHTEKAQDEALRSAAVLVNVYDMGPCTSEEHRSATIIQCAWRQGLACRQAQRLVWKREAEYHRQEAAVRIQVQYRSWMGWKYGREVKWDKQERERAATAIQCAWRWVQLGIESTRANGFQ